MPCFSSERHSIVPRCETLTNGGSGCWKMLRNASSIESAAPHLERSTKATGSQDGSSTSLSPRHDEEQRSGWVQRPPRGVDDALKQSAGLNSKNKMKSQKQKIFGVFILARKSKKKKKKTSKNNELKKKILCAPLVDFLSVCGKKKSTHFSSKTTVNSSMDFFCFVFMHNWR